MEKSIHSANYRLFLSLLRAAREGAGLTQEELASRLQETQSFVSKCERGERRVDVAELRLFCEALGTSFVEFVAAFDRAVEGGAKTGRRRR